MMLLEIVINIKTLQNAPLKNNSRETMPQTPPPRHEHVAVSI